jgi:hypothetical protein
MNLTFIDQLDEEQIATAEQNCYAGKTSRQFLLRLRFLLRIKKARCVLMFLSAKQAKLASCKFVLRRRKL